MKILYIDDHSESRLLVRHILEARGYQVIEAEDGFSGIRVAEAESPDLILIDIMMPGLDGRETTTRFRGIPRLESVPIVALTANAMSGDRERALAAGCDGFLQKPVDVDRLPGQIQAFLQGKRELLEPSEELLYLREHNKRLAERLDQQVQRLQNVTEQNKRLIDRVLIDELTGLPNKGYLLRRLREEFAMADRLGNSLCCMMIEIDHFQSIKQAHGTEMSNEILQLLAKVFSDSKREYDVIGRYGGEVFLFLLPQTIVPGVLVMAERLRQKVEGIVFPSDPKQSIRLTISLGVAALETEEALEAEEFLRHADQALYRAKEGGRNRVILFQRPA